MVQLYVDDYGNGVVGAYNRKGKGRTLELGRRMIGVADLKREAFK